MSVHSNEEIKRIIEKFNFEGENIEFAPYGNGHINDTFVVVNKTEKGQIRYILQRINTSIFKDPLGVMDNILKVCQYLKNSGADSRSVMSLILTKDGKSCIIEDNLCWRAYAFIEDSICLELPDSTDDFYECAVAFGRFQKYLNGFPAAELHETIPQFHDTVKRFNDFKNSVAKNVSGRADNVKEEIEFVKAREDFYSVLMDANKAGVLPLRVTHNDTKSNNVMLDAKTRKALCVVDLDTIMPGFSVTDFGDSIRFGASTASEDEKDLDKVWIDLDMFEAYVKGFLDGCDGMLTKEEIMLLPEGAKMMTIECGMRFLADYIDGDTYFKTKYPEHNLDRAHTQFKLVADMEKHWDEMKAIVKKYS